ncbi:MAG TPA: serine/threonine-protein kinase [Polyangiaceae bacterium]|nr:serine/threonine-protein kinase [Polyangiaceae bacterium]
MRSGEPPFNLVIAGKYRLIGLLGEGHTSIVYEAVHEALGSALAIKVLRSELRERADIVARFRVEGRALAQLDHPNVLRVHDVGMLDDGRPFMVLQRLWGHTLAEEIKRSGALAPERAVTIARGILAALGRVHSLGMVHRDLTPQNVFLNEDGSSEALPVLLDFGQAKVLSSQPLPLNAPTPACSTPEDVCWGTPRTASPEYVELGEIDARSDVYSAGVVLYWMLAGRDPFHDALTTEEVFRAQVLRQADPPSRWTLHQVPAALDEVVMQALEKNPKQRFDSVEQFAAALDEAMRVQPPAAGASANAGRPWPTTQFGAAAFVVGIAGFALVTLLLLFPSAVPFSEAWLKSR